MKILLAMPTWTEDLGGFAKIGKVRNPQAPLGLLYLAAIAENKGNQVTFVDCDVENVSLSALAKKVAEEKYEMVGLSATSPIFHKAVKAAEAIKALAPSTVTVIGGDHINHFKKEVFFPPFDFAVYGEGEETWAELIDTFASTAPDYKAINGLIWRDGENIIENNQRRLFPNLDDLPWPAVHLKQMESYRMTFVTPAYRNTGKYVSIMMTRGCPFKCSFCSESSAVKHGGDALQVRFRSPENIIKEIEFHYRTHDIRHFFFMDSNITLRKRHIVEVCERLIELNLPITFEGWTRANLINDELVALMAKAGMIRMSIGVESGDPEIMKIIKKEVSLDEIRNAFRLIDKYGIEPACSAMLGNPGETKKDVYRTIEFINSIPEVLYTNFSISNPYPGTEMLKWAHEGKHGLRLIHDDLSMYTRYDDSPIEVNDLSAKDLVWLQTYGLIRLHLRPKRLVSAIRMIGFWTLLPTVTRMFFKLFRKLSNFIPAYHAEAKRS